ncbi:MAG: hypothetical protein WDN00_02585 [Limisphaerales bacterium]
MKSKIFHLVIALALGLAGTTTVSAETLLLHGATVHTVSGETFSPGDVLIKDGKIAAVGKALPAGDATIVDLAGKHLYPGMIALDTTMGLTEIDAVRATQDSREVGDYTPDVQSWIAVNPDSELLPVARGGGIAYFEPVPQGNILSGQSGLVRLDGWTTEQMAYKKPEAFGTPELSRRADACQRFVHEHGITYNVYGDPRGMERPWQLDPIHSSSHRTNVRTLETGLIAARDAAE